MGERIGLEGATNFRDFGGFGTESGSSVAEKKVFRADGLHRLTDNDVAILESLDVKWVFDLRTGIELEHDGLGPFVGSSAEHHHVPLISVSLNPFDGDVDWSQIDLQDRYLEMLEQGREAFRGVVGKVIDVDSGAVVFHCSGGKDRTGVVAAVLLELLGVERDAVIADYARSENYLGELLDQYRDQLAEQGVTPETLGYLTSSPPERMARMLEQMSERWGDARSYLKKVPGLTDKELDLFSKKMLVNG